MAHEDREQRNVSEIDEMKETMDIRVEEKQEMENNISDKSLEEKLDASNWDYKFIKFWSNQSIENLVNIFFTNPNKNFFFLVNLQPISKNQHFFC